MDGKNVADFIDPDIMARLEELEADEEAREAAGEYDSDPEEDEESQSIRAQAAAIRDRKQSIRFSARQKTSRNHPVIPQKVKAAAHRPVHFARRRSASQPLNKQIYYFASCSRLVSWSVSQQTGRQSPISS